MGISKQCTLVDDPSNSCNTTFGSFRIALKTSRERIQRCRTRPTLHSPLAWCERCLGGADSLQGQCSRCAGSSCACISKLHRQRTGRREHQCASCVVRSFALRRETIRTHAIANYDQRSKQNPAALVNAVASKLYPDRRNHRLKRPQRKCPRPQPYSSADKARWPQWKRHGLGRKKSEKARP